MPTVIPGKLKLKGSSVGDKKKKKVKKRTRDEEEVTSSANSSSSSTLKEDPDAFLTDTQRKFEQKKRKAELDKAKDVIGTTYRDRVEKFNYNLSVKSEHNDIPRISAAGNG